MSNGTIPTSAHMKAVKSMSIAHKCREANLMKVVDVVKAHCEADATDNSNLKAALEELEVNSAF